ncbi:unnamed protein product [Camellia sinensis]
MGSLESGFSLKRDQTLLCSFSSSAGRNERKPFGQRPRSRFVRLFLFKKIDYLHWICTVAVFFFLVLFQMFLPGSVIEKSKNSWREGEELTYRDLMLWKEIGGLDFGEDIKFEPSKLLAKFQKESNEVNMSSVLRR